MPKLRGTGMKKALVLLGLFYSPDVAAQGYFVPAEPYAYYSASVPHYPASRQFRPNPYAGGMGMSAYAGNAFMSASRPVPPSVLPRVSPVPLRSGPSAADQGTAVGEDTAFFKQYIKDHPEVMPDIKLKGSYEW